ncbi:uncharacterized protein BDZ99DRAFT_461906 [Mytilinidion resinicola]|uniref:Uncharacterized protein n=1 Tax=Mytilinidion resinicola TaxID=574789 RepID=A0A6A6YVL1_9PEZI|nr:uncharacterized protein BDZ99DRAFT_461906 [Mytilinidion resinicola]KAF2811957.1 hypothetical protein BDZ99DRAFT_461906 [Mytilinidion resinicola]
MEIFDYPHSALNTSFDNFKTDVGSALDWGGYLGSTNLSAFTENLAATLTTQIRNAPSAGGDNANATTFRGTAQASTTYVEVRWQWLILPVAETLLTAVLFVISVAMTRHLPLLKTSVIALLSHGLDGCWEDELETTSPETAEKLEDLAKGLSASFQPNSQGQLRFVRS